MSRFFVPPERIDGKSIKVSGKEAHHILDVMRLGVSDKVVTFDGTGREYAGVIREISRGTLVIEVTEIRTVPAGNSAQITLIQALPKKDKMDYVVEKSTELGVYSILPVLTSRTIPDWSEAKIRAQAQRWQKIATEAAKQCGRADVPRIGPIVKFIDAVKNRAEYELKLIAVLDDDTIAMKKVVYGSHCIQIAAAIGPEGDFTKEECRLAKDYGFKAVSLGPRVLKSDTAGLAVIAILNYELAD